MIAGIFPASRRWEPPLPAGTHRSPRSCPPLRGSACSSVSLFRHGRTACRRPAGRRGAPRRRKPPERRRICMRQIFHGKAPPPLCRGQPCANRDSVRTTGIIIQFSHDFQSRFRQYFRYVVPAGIPAAAHAVGIPAGRDCHAGKKHSVLRENPSFVDVSLYFPRILLYDRDNVSQKEEADRLWMTIRLNLWFPTTTARR